MRVDIARYKANKESTQRWYLDKGVKFEDPEYCVSMMACSSMCPAIVVAYWIGEVSGWPEIIQETIRRLTAFYGYTEILNKPEGSPV